MKSKLISIPRTNLLYLPIIKIHDSEVSRLYGPRTGITTNISNTYVVAVDEATEGPADGVESTFTTEFRRQGLPLQPGARTLGTGVLGGFRPNNRLNPNFIEVHQGLDTGEIPPSFAIDSDLRETQYIVEIDNRLGSIANYSGAVTPVSFVDDDNIASYFLSLATGGYINTDRGGRNGPPGTGVGTNVSPISGPRGTSLAFKIKASIELATSTFLFTKLGGTMTDDGTSTTRNFYFIDTTIRVTGATTGYRIDIPVRFVKYKA